ncbi:MAG: hypothetical protein K8U57_30480 [Planctomycetes bacterium]|nr:hypothetical protein [Planctomycetota bacterium]
MADLGELKVTIKADSAAYEQAMKRVTGVTQQSASQMQSAFGVMKAQLMELVPALSAVALVEFGRRAVDAASQIQDMADRIGFAASSLAALETPLKTNGSSVDEFAASVNRMNNMIGEAAKGTNQEAIKAFDELGLSVRKLQAMSPEEQFYEVTQAIMQLGTQAQITNAGMSIFGRAFSAMQPMLKESHGALSDYVDKQKELNEALSDETIKRIDDFGDHLEAAAIKARNAFLEAFAAILKVVDSIPDAESLGEKAGASLRNAFGMGPKPTATPAEIEDLKSRMGYGEKYGPAFQQPSSKGSNAALLKPTGGTTKALEPADYDKLTDSVDGFITKLEEENKVLGLNKKEAAGMKAVYEAQAKAMAEGNLLTTDQIEKVKGLAEANEELKNKMQEADRFSKELHDGLAKGLADVALSADNAANSIANFANQIANTLLQKKITGPIADALIGTDGKTGILDDLLSGLGFASGGRPPLGKASMVGENGPELFIPDTSGTIIPNGGSGGGVSVTNVFNISPGIQGTVQAEINRAIPAIIAASTNSVMSGIEKGGRAAQIVGKRS